MAIDFKNNPVIWSPSEERLKSSQMYLFMQNVNQSYNLKLTTFEELHEWSVSFKNNFWSSIWDFFNILGSKGKQPYI